MDREVGINKEIDKLGRLVIPKEKRMLYNLKERAELIVTDEGILIRNPLYKLVKVEVESKDCGVQN